MTTDVIIGLPSILYHFYDVFSTLLSTARRLIVNDELRDFPRYVNSDHKPDVLCSMEPVCDSAHDCRLIPPWTSLDQPAPEDVESYEPVMFKCALHFMEMTVQQAEQEYFELFDSHIAPEFVSSCPQILDLLRNKGLRVFVPQNWLGINGLEPIQFQFSDDMPKVHKPKTRPVNPRLFADTLKEYKRLLQYHLVPSDSPFVSNLVVAPKATKPFVRLCGDYVFVNKFITAGYFVIPPVPHILEKIANFAIYVDLDLVNAFHQLPLAEETSKRLSILTPWGTARPKFLPEGVKPASEILQRVVHELFNDFSEWLIYQFDNLLILAHTYDDAYAKLECVLDRCIERNVFLKFSKSYIGFTKVHFFGYDCQYTKFELSQDRKENISKIPFPTNLKQMQSFLGAALFFKSFVPNYSSKTALLNDMIHKDFPWNHPESWKVDYRAIFEDFKLALLNATANYYPNYDLPWILRTDASLYGVGAVLLQVYTDPKTKEQQYQPIAFASKKFSEQASRWSTIEQEAFGIYFAVHHFSYYLRCKDFVIETDHNNLLWMDASPVPKIIRWKIYLQSFRFDIRHIPGKHNAVADWLSRLQCLSTDCVNFPNNACCFFCSDSEEEDDNYDIPNIAILQRMAHDRIPPTVSQNNNMRTMTLSDELHDPTHDDDHALIPTTHSTHMKEKSLVSSVPTMPPKENIVAPQTANSETMPTQSATSAEEETIVEHLTQLQMLQRVHNSRAGHRGIKATMYFLDKHFPGHGISQLQVDDFISTCITCQKDRLTMKTARQAVVRHIKPPHQRGAVGVDILSFSPPDKFGNVCLIVIVNHFTKYTAIYPSKDHKAESLARALFLYYITFGVYDEIHSDPGSDLTSEVVEHLHRWFVMKHVFSLVDRHQSNGVEGPNREILRHLKALIFDERLKDSWGDDIVVAIVQYIINMVDSSETGVIPMHAHFGSADATYHRMPLTLTDAARTHAFVRLLDAQLRFLVDKSKQYQAALVEKRLASTPAEKQNLYQPGDYVLIKMDVDGKPLPFKASPRYFGPYKVSSQYKNDITCTHVVRQRTVTVHVERVKPFYGNEQAAHEAALLDYDEYDVINVDSYRGEPLMRTSLEFRVTFANGAIKWLPYSDVSELIFLDMYCHSRSDLLPLTFSKHKDAETHIKMLKKQPITMVAPGDIVYVSLRSYGGIFYKSLPMEDRYDKDYVVTYYII